MYVYAIRHAQTEANQNQLCIGWTDSPIVEESRQWKKLALNLKDFPRSGNTSLVVYSSDITRASITARHAAQELGVDQRAIKYTQDLRELNYGRFEGQSIAVVRRAQPQLFDSGGNFLPDVPVGGGESVSQMLARARKFLGEIESLQCSSESPNHVLIVSHGGVICALLSLVRGEDYNYTRASFSVDHLEVIPLFLPPPLSFGAVNCQSS